MFAYFFYWKVIFTERRRDRENDLPSAGSLPKWLQCLELSQFEAKGQEFLLGLPHRCRVPKPVVLATSRELD